VSAYSTEGGVVGRTELETMKRLLGFSGISRKPARARPNRLSAIELERHLSVEHFLSVDEPHRAEPVNSGAVVRQGGEA